MAKTRARKVRAKTQAKYDIAMKEDVSPAVRLAEFKSAAGKNSIRQASDIEAAGNVICRGKKKPIYLINGSFVMVPGHATEREIAVGDLGGRMCRCLEALKELKACRLGDLPALFHDALVVAAKKRRRRQQLQRISQPRHLVEIVKAGAIGNMQRKVRLLLRLKTTYKTSHDARCRIYVDNAIGSAHVYGGIYCLDSNNLPTAEIRLRLNSTWRKVIHPQGLSVIGGVFVTDILVFEDGRHHAADASAAIRLVEKARDSKGMVVVQVIAESSSVNERRYRLDDYEVPYKELEVRLCTKQVRIDFSGLKPRLRTT